MAQQELRGGEVTPDDDWPRSEQKRSAQRDTRARGHAELVDDATFWTPRRVAMVGALWVAGAVALALLAVAAHAHPEFPGDVVLADALQRLRGTPLDSILTFASSLNWPKPAGIIALAVILVLAALRRIRAALCTAVAGFGADLANVTLNGLVERPRPNDVSIHVVAHLGLHSFPSGHVTHVVGFYGFLLYLTLRVGRAQPRLRPALWVVRAACLYFLVCIGPARVLAGEHWPSDVLGSYLLGALVLVVAIALYHLLAIAWLRLREGRQGMEIAAPAVR